MILFPDEAVRCEEIQQELEFQFGFGNELLGGHAVLFESFGQELDRRALCAPFDRNATA